MKHRLRVLGTDALGILLIICAGLFGWLPGPGGIPLLLGGLGLLAINHEWARRWIRKLRDGGSKLSDKIFPNHWVAKIVYDILAVLALGLSVWLVFYFTDNVRRSLGIILLFVGLSILIFNRKRIDKLKAWLDKVSRKQPPKTKTKP